jgi:hypothetical protein
MIAEGKQAEYALQNVNLPIQLQKLQLIYM